MLRRYRTQGTVPYPGKFIVIDGIDGSGKTTQAELLATQLRGMGVEVFATKEPTYSRVGLEIRQRLKEGKADDAILMAHLFAADRAIHLTDEIEPALAAGKLVLCDRYYHASIIYQGMCYGPVELAYVTRLNEWFLVPDLTIILQVSIEQAMNRIAARQSADSFDLDKKRLDRTHAVYDCMPRTNVLEDERFVVVDGNGDPEIVHHRLLNRIDEAVSSFGLVGILDSSEAAHE